MSISYRYNQLNIHAIQLNNKTRQNYTSSVFPYKMIDFVIMAFVNTVNSLAIIDKNHCH